MTGFDIAAQLLGVAYVNVYMAVLSQVSRSEALDVEDLRLYATDTLDYEQGGHLLQVLPLIVDEGQRALLEQSVAISTKAKREGSYRLVIGNPPYHNNSTLPLGRVAERFPRLLRSSVEAGGAQRRNIRDDYAWFFAAADRYVQDDGVICFVVSDSFASKASYGYFREEFLRHYHVRLLVRLGEHVFSDVGYRTSFAIVLLEKRDVPLESAEEAEPVPYHDLRPLADGVATHELGTPDDPRLAHLGAVGRAEEELGEAELYAPVAATKFSFYPGTAVAARFTTEGLAPLHERTGPRLFARRWPGIITAFDVLFKGRTREELGERMSSFFGVCRSGATGSAQFEQQIERWGELRGFNNDQKERLLGLAWQVRNQEDLTYDESKVKRSFSGSIPNSARWYPPAEHVHHLYYEPRLFVPRNRNPGRPAGWGNMNQWREPASHGVAPKLIYTTADRPRNGYSAFVVDGGWYAKLHGGTSQQFHYTGLEDPGRPHRTDGSPNNLEEEGLAVMNALAEAGGTPESLLYYVAGVWNSSLADELLAAVANAVRPGVRIPKVLAEAEAALEVADLARTARDLTRLGQLFGDVPADKVLAADVDPWAREGLLSELGLERAVERHGRFRAEESYVVPEGVADLVRELLEAAEARIEELVEGLHP